MTCRNRSDRNPLICRRMEAGIEPAHDFNLSEGNRPRPARQPPPRTGDLDHALSTGRDEPHHAQPVAGG